MLTQFSVSNYRSIKNTITLDFTAAKISELSERIIPYGGEKILPVAVIYGANASGKSNVINAFAFMKEYVKDSFSYGGETNKHDLRDCFAFDDESSKAPSVFEVFYLTQVGKRFVEYNYGFSLGEDGVLEEWLNKRNKSSKDFDTVFYRKKDKVSVEKLKKVESGFIEGILDREVLFLSLGAKLKIKELRLVRDLICDAMFMDYGDPEEDSWRARMMPYKFASDESVQEDVVKFLSSFDDSIVGFKVERIDDKKKDSKYKIDSKHRMQNSEELKSIRFENESSGTIKMFTLFTPIKTVLEDGGILFVDELNAKLHPLLVRNVVLAFLNPKYNTNHAQLVFTTHEAWLLSSGLFRRDEIWFTEKTNNGETTLYSFYDVVDEHGQRIRKDESFEKNYLLGKYGAIPELKPLYPFLHEGVATNGKK